MSLRIRDCEEKDIKAVVALSLLAWAPVFDSFGQVLGPEIYARLYPDWTSSQRKLVEDVCRDRAKYIVQVAELVGNVAGFVAYSLNVEEQIGEVYLLAVHPEYQNRGIGTKLTNAALGDMRQREMKLAHVGTGGDPAHAPARRTYEKAGFRALPVVQYYKYLGG